MCEINKSATPAKGGGIDLSLTCETTGKPITVSNEYGMFCADMCGYKEAKDVGDDLKAVFGNMNEDREDMTEAEEMQEMQNMMNGLFNVFQKHGMK